MRIGLSVIILTFFCIKAYTQTDTIYVYEDVIHYDTVYVYDTIFERTDIEALSVIEPIKFSMLVIDSVSKKASLLLVFEKQSATIPINGIILNENIKNLESMKKLSFFGVMFFAFNSIVLAQTDYGISVGGGAWWANSSYNNPNAGGYFSPTFNAGLYWEFLLKNNVLLKTELNYHYLKSNIEYIPDTVNWSYSAYGPPLEVSYIKNENSAINYHQFSIPLKVGYKFKNVIPFIGATYSYRYSLNSENDNINIFSALLGVKYEFSEKFSLEIDYSYGLTNDFELSGDIRANSTYNKLSENSVFWKSNLIKLSLNYSFKKRRKKEDCIEFENL